MSWSYSGDPSASNSDNVRFLIGDTDITDQQLTNEEITAMLTAHGSVYPAAIACLEALVAKYARKVDKSMGDLSISYGRLADNYRSMLTDLRRRATIETCTPYAGGISISDKETDEEDSDRVAPTFSVGMHDSEPSNDEDSKWFR